MLLCICRNNKLLIPDQCGVRINIHSNFALRNALPFIYSYAAAVCSIDKYFQVAAFCFAIPGTIKLFEYRLAKAGAGAEYNKQYEQ
ncbi:hypothetical protein D3C87_1537080 [compost metagenome]